MVDDDFKKVVFHMDYGLLIPFFPSSAVLILVTGSIGFFKERNPATLKGRICEEKGSEWNLQGARSG